MRRLIFIVLAILPLITKAPQITTYEKQLKIHTRWLEQKKLRQEQQLESFLFHLSLRESAHKWKIINRLGYMGKYQFGNDALSDIGFKHITTRRFRRNPNIFPIHLQDIAVKRYMYFNANLLQKHMKYIGCTINGVMITKSGLLAAAHLGGAGNVKEFLESEGEINFADDNETKLTEYLETFKNYNF